MVLLISGLFLACSGAPAAAAAAVVSVAPPTSADSIFQFTDLVGIDGSPISLAHFKGNVTLVVNVASY